MSAPKAVKVSPAEHLGRVEALADELQAAQMEEARARTRLNAAIHEAVRAGVAKAQIARRAGVSRQRISSLSLEGRS